MSAVAEPFEVCLDGGVLELTLTTPACSHNIFNLNAATQLCRILAEADTSRVAVVLIKSGKPGSFINGVGLLMAGTAQKPEDIPAMTQGVTRAYRALREFPAPSVAAIAGNCYGCGVEFALHCDYRLAREDYETHFYMTEIADYLFIPAFGATQDLPRLLGIEAATDFLLWGERWSARQAVGRGLADGSFAVREFDDAVGKFVRHLATAPRKRPLAPHAPWGPQHEAHTAATRARIERLPPPYQPVYRDGHALMLRAAKGAQVTEMDYAAEIRACSESVIRPVAKASVSLFFIRQLASHYCLRGYALPQLTEIAMDPADTNLLALRRELEQRRVRGLAIVNTATAPAACSLELTTVPSTGNSACTETIGVILEPRARSPQGHPECVLYAPFCSGASRLIEIACGNPREAVARRAFAMFDRAGYCPILSQPRAEFATNLLLAHHLAPLVSFVLNGGAAAEAHRSLRDFGFVKPLAPLVASIPAGLLCDWLQPLIPGVEPSAMRSAIAELVGTDSRTGTPHQSLIDTLLRSLGDFATESISSGVVPHPSLVDVMARELIDFPLGHGSLCRLLSEREPARKFYNTAAAFGGTSQVRDRREARA